MENIMAQFIKHVGKHGDRKVAVVYREVPGEPHMCLVVYTELLNRTIHDPLIKCIESDIGQNSANLAEALNRTYTTDGKIILHKLHTEGLLKKVQTEQIIMTPTPNVRIKLSELNALLDEMEKGEEAIKRLQEIDAQAGIQDPAQVAKRMREFKESKTNLSTTTDVLDDVTIAKNLREQALKMAQEAKSLLLEADRLIAEANQLDPIKVNEKVSNIEIVEKKTKGRPKKITNSI
jgi:hypothetical protein